MNRAPYLLPGRALRLPPRQRRARSTRPSTTACGARSRTATWAPTPSASRSSDHVSREDQDAFALASHQKAIAAIDAGRFDAEMAPVTVRDAQGPRDGRRRRRGPAPRLDARGARPAQARLRPARRRGPRRRRRSARSPPATRPGITDGAAATVVASERAVERLGLKPLARIVGYAQAEVAPKWLFLAPVEGVRRLLDRIEMPIEAFDLIEINEAFAAQTLADGRELGFDWDKVNVNGGAIALGHPIGASGARIVATLLHELARREGRYGLATLCLGGGGSVAAASSASGLAMSGAFGRELPAERPRTPDASYGVPAEGGSMVGWSDASSVSVRPRRTGWLRRRPMGRRTWCPSGASWSRTISPRTGDPNTAKARNLAANPGRRSTSTGSTTP